ncbi:MAG: glutamate ABC transporter substrate-binding protein [Actinomycetota bacterium]|nr:glutamate ABC transporter substrate-binding protein [Actinomycetota bacterium]
MHRHKRWWWIVALLTALTLTAAACGDDGEDGGDGGDGDGQEQEFPAGSTMAELQDAGKVVIGVKFDVPPFGFENPQTGEVEGFDVDLGNIIAEELGVEAEFVEAISDNRIPFLQDGTVDMILSTMTITTDRAVEIDYSRPYFVAHGRILVPEGSDIQGIDDLNGKKVCTGLGSTYETTIKEQAPDADLKLVESYSECYENLQNEAVDAVSTDDVILTGMIIQSEDQPLEMVGEQMTVEPYGVGIPDGDQELAGFVSEVIEGTFESGEWQDMYDKWVGKYTGEDPDHPEGYTLSDAYELFPCDEFCKEAKEEEDVQNPAF